MHSHLFLLVLFAMFVSLVFAVIARDNAREQIKLGGLMFAGFEGGMSQKCRKKVEEVFGWLKGIAGLGRSRMVGRWKLRQLLEVGAAAFNLVRLRKLKPA